MLTANQVRALKEALQKQAAEVELYKILVDIAEDAISLRSRGYVYCDLDYVDERVNLIVDRLRYMGYTVQVDKYPEDGYSSLTIRF